MECASLSDLSSLDFFVRHFRAFFVRKFSRALSCMLFPVLFLFVLNGLWHCLLFLSFGFYNDDCFHFPFPFAGFAEISRGPALRLWLSTVIWPRVIGMRFFFCSFFHFVLIFSEKSKIKKISKSVMIKITFVGNVVRKMQPAVLILFFLGEKMNEFTVDFITKSHFYDNNEEEKEEKFTKAGCEPR